MEALSAAVKHEAILSDLRAENHKLVGAALEARQVVNPFVATRDKKTAELLRTARLARQNMPQQPIGKSRYGLSR